MDFTVGILGTVHDSARPQEHAVMIAAIRVDAQQAALDGPGHAPARFAPATETLYRRKQLTTHPDVTGIHVRRSPG